MAGRDASVRSIWLREGVLVPDVVVDITALPLRDIRDRRRIGLESERWFRILGPFAWNYSVQSMFPAVSQALQKAVRRRRPDPHVYGERRGNLLQRNWCPYFRELAAACNKRAPRQRLRGL